MDNYCGLGSIGNSFAALGCSDPGETVLVVGTVKVPQGVFFVPTLFVIFSLFCLHSSSVSLTYFNLTLLLPCGKSISGEHPCMISIFPIAILNGTWSLPSLGVIFIAVEPLWLLGGSEFS